MVADWIKELELELKDIVREWGPWAAWPEVHMHPDLAFTYLLEVRSWSRTGREAPRTRLRGVFARIGRIKLVADTTAPRGVALIHVRDTVVSVVLT